MYGTVLCCTVDILIQPIINTAIGFASGMQQSVSNPFLSSFLAHHLSPYTANTLLLPPYPYLQLTGILFILAIHFKLNRKTTTKQALSGWSEEQEELGPDTLNVGWEKMILIMFVMTLHSLTEGVGEWRLPALSLS